MLSSILVDVEHSDLTTLSYSGKIDRHSQNSTYRHAGRSFRFGSLGFRLSSAVTRGNWRVRKTHMVRDWNF